MSVCRPRRARGSTSALSIGGGALHICDMAKSPSKSSPQPAGASERRRRSPLTEFLDAAEPLQPQGIFGGAAGRFHRRAAQGIGRGLGRADREGGRGRARRPVQARSRRKIPERSSAPTKTARGTSMGGAASARERAAAGLNPVAGLDIDLEDAERMTTSGVTATVSALSALIESGNPLHKNGQLWTPHRPARPEKSEGGIAIVMKSDFEPAGDQPTAIKDLVEGVDARRPHAGAARRHRLRQDLHHGQGDRGDAAPGADPGAQQDAGRAALQRVQEILPRQRGRVFRLLLRLLPAGGLRPAHRHLYREGIVDQRADRPHAPFGDALAARARRRRHRRLGVLHLRYRLGRDLYGDDLPDAGRRPARPARAARRPRRPAIQAPGRQFRARLVPRARRHHRDLPGPPRGLGLAHHHVRRRDRDHHRVRSADRPEDRRPEVGQDLRQFALCDAAADAQPGDQVDQGRAGRTGSPNWRRPAACWRRSGWSSARASTSRCWRPPAPAPASRTIRAI